LAGLPIKELHGDFESQQDFELLRSMKTLQTINEKPAAEFLAQKK
jgi:hypothetical protein